MVNIFRRVVQLVIVVQHNIQQVVHIVMVHLQAVQQLQMDINLQAINVVKNNAQLTHMEQAVLVHHVQVDLVVQKVVLQKVIAR